jgi:integrase
MYTDVLFKNFKWFGADKGWIRKKECTIKSVTGGEKARSHCAPFQSAKSFSQWLVKARKAAKLPDECVPHGLRKVAATNLAEAGASEFMLMSVMGWTNPSQAKVYTEKARRKSMAKKAMDMLDDEEQK